MKYIFHSILLVGWLLLVCNCSAQQRQGFERFGYWAKDDPISLFRDFGPKQIVGMGAAGVALVSLSALDESSSRQFQQNYSDSQFLSITNTFGDKTIVLPASAIIFGSSLLTKNTKLQDAAFTSLESVLITSLTVGAGKFLFARSRPFEQEGAYDFDFVKSGETSFPSGHTSTAFAFVTPWVMYYPNALTYSLLAIPAGTAIARIAEGKHWLSDVTAGAAIGFSMGYYLSKKHLGTQNMQITPTFGKNLTAVSINFQF